LREIISTDERLKKTIPHPTNMPSYLKMRFNSKAIFAEVECKMAIARQTFNKVGLPR
jgi:hypothetical protein